ncbi:type II toxin-antitoxin system HicB family antitoxin [Aerococcaceae bacterium WS4759]|uniref:Type II toxin-antitoxin system HicB family antitoxin n=1 Tax=Fundicoccus ignavus TaxID=2664442 RepID=A0A6I2GKH5_9LACT|nr:type II toxin-antitoxin system HicB family antitoxin [Fundicoccus ignavus]MRI86352.1 type II toxin-antitoxin system HicB family antitoxin [Fundicoccus ignavus]
MIKIYPAIFEQDAVGFGIYFPDVDGAETQGETVEEGLEMASDALGIQLAWHVEKQIPLPNMSHINDLAINKETQFVTLVSVNLLDYLQDSVPDKKTIKIPHWLNVRATKAGINFSKTMTEALMEKLQV